MISTAITHAIAGKPNANNKGAATADGVPQPVEPSIRQPNSQATMIICTRRSGEISIKPWRMALIAPLCFKVFKIKMAEKTMNKTFTAVNTP